MSKSYATFAATMVASLIVMFALSMSMVRQWDHYYINLSNFYMALIMVSAMGIIMMVGMRSMFTNKRINIALYVGFAALFVGFFFLGRNEAGVGNEQFLKSMIPHHSRAILVCQEAHITDPQIEGLCEEIVAAQKKEIAEMKRILADRY